MTGLSSSGPAEGPDWPETMARVRAMLARRAPRAEVEDLAGEVFLDLVEHLHAQRPVRCWPGLVSSLVRTRLNRLRRCVRSLVFVTDERLDERCRRCDDKKVEASATEPCIDPSRLRGRLQRAIASGVCAGKDCAQLAAELHQPAKEIRRVLERLCAALAKN